MVDIFLLEILKFVLRCWKTHYSSLIVDLVNKNINCCLNESTFPNDFKKVVAHTIHKKDCNLNICKIKNLITHKLASC